MRRSCTDRSPARSAASRRGARDSRRRAGAEHRCEPAAVLYRHEGQQPLRRRGQRAHPLEEHALDVRRQRNLIREPFGAGELPGRESLGKLDEGEGVAGRLTDQAIADGRGDLAIDGVRDELARSGVVEAVEHELGQAAGVEAGVAHAVASGEEHDDALALQPPRDEQQRVGRRHVEPLRVVDEAQDRPFLGELRQQRQHGDRDQEPVVAAALPEAQRALERGGLGRGQVVAQSQGGPDELMQAGERELGLRLDAASREDVRADREDASLVEERGLADARLAPDDECPAAGRAGGLEQPDDVLAFPPASAEHGAMLRRGGGRDPVMSVTSGAAPRG